MDEILNLKIEDMPGLSFDCSCGRKHSIGINKIYIGTNPENELLNLLKDFKKKKVFLTADNNTFKVCGNKILDLLNKNDFQTASFVFETTSPLVPDEKAVERLLAKITPDISLIITVGSGTLNDLARFLSFKLGIPYIIVCTAPSMDGYASMVSALIISGFKKTFEAVFPYAAIADMEIIKNAPMEMIRAGFGDIIGKFTALADWQLSGEINKEYFCKTSAMLVKNALDKCVSNAEKIGKRDEEAIEQLLEALILTGVAMGLTGNSRPASGAEHHLAHYWEMDALSHGREHPLHGNSVGAASVVISALYHLFSDDLITSLNVPEPEHLQKLLNAAGAADSPKTLGIGRKLFKESLIHAMEIRPRYTIFHYAAKAGLLEKYSDILTQRFYD